MKFLWKNESNGIFRHNKDNIVYNFLLLLEYFTQSSICVKLTKLNKNNSLVRRISPIKFEDLSPPLKFKWKRKISLQVRLLNLLFKEFGYAKKKQIANNIYIFAMVNQYFNINSHAFIFDYNRRTAYLNPGSTLWKHIWQITSNFEF